MVWFIEATTAWIPVILADVWKTTPFVALLLLAGCASVPAETGASRWWKGNLHTQSVWSDGTDYPEMIVAWYLENGYDFLALTEHDMLAEGERWWG